MIIFPTVPDPVTDIISTPFGVTCIGIQWTPPDNNRGPDDNLTYFVVVNGTSSSEVVVFNTNASDGIELNSFITLVPTESYVIEVRFISTYVHTCACTCMCQ